MGFLGFGNNKNKKQIPREKLGYSDIYAKNLNYEQIAQEYLGEGFDRIEKTYNTSQDIQRCVAIRQKEFLNTMPHLNNLQGEKDEEASKRFFELFDRGFTRFKNRAYLSLMVYGYALIQKVKNVSDEVIKYKIIELKNLKEIIFDDDNLVKSVILLNDEIIDKNDLLIFSKFNDLNHPELGTSPVALISPYVLLDGVATRFNIAFFGNDSSPDIAYIVKGAEKEEIEGLKNSLTKELKGVKNAGRSSIFSFSDKDTQFDAQAFEKKGSLYYREVSELAKNAIASAFGVPHSLLRADGKGDTYNNADSYYDQMIEEIINEEEEFKNLFSQEIPEGYEFHISPDHNKNLQYYADFWTKLIDAGIATPYEAAKKMGIDCELSEEDEKWQKQLKK